MYRIKTRAENLNGLHSEYSDALVVALGSVPAPPSKPVKVVEASGPEQIAVRWNPLSGETLPVYGYRLYSDLGTDDEYQLVFDGQHKVTTTEYVLQNVTDPAVTYKFYATATNFNGEGPASQVAHLKACTLPKPGRGSFDAPVLEAVSSTQISISWQAPKDDGGCRIISYAIYLDDSDGIYVEYDAANVNNKPFLSSYDIDMSSKTPGKTYSIQLGANNVIGAARSEAVVVTLASVPAAPSPPSKQLLNETHMEVHMTPPSSDGGDMIMSYQLQLRLDHNVGDWDTVLGVSGSNNLKLTYAVPIEEAGQLI